VYSTERQAIFITAKLAVEVIGLDLCPAADYLLDFRQRTHLGKHATVARLNLPDILIS
jgi:hypothetical protein